MEDTDSIRALAPKWSLAGDEKLLNLLQTTHQRIVTKCREVNTKLEDMASSLDDASISLQNVNNKFMALSNSQFIESRVYDDDDVTMKSEPIEEPKKAEIDELTVLRRSLAVLDAAHESTEILDVSDSEDSDAEISVVLKHRDVYAHRPLPHIIGSHAWKNKWHAGLILEDSESDSETSKQDVRDLVQFSESDEDVQTNTHVPDATISETSSSFHSERDKELSIEKKQTPADVAAELAARLGNAPPRVLEEPEDLPQPTPKPVYRPQKPVSSTIFSDEPPPLDPKEYSSESHEEDDIFAEINKKQPYYNRNTAQNTAGLFGTVDEDFGFKESKSAKKSTLFDDDSETELFVEPPNTEVITPIKNDTKDHIKKPTGGISLFGTNKGTESIGAAILKRNQRESSSDSESDGDKNTIKNNQAAANEDSNVNNANYIFDNLFAKAKQAEQKMVKPTKIDIPEEKPKSEVKDLFSDNIFDDIDDIFTSNIKIPTKEYNKNAKSIFDDDDDLFSDISKIKEPKDTNASSSKKSIFDSDDDLFSDVKITKESTTKLKITERESQVNKPVPITSKETNNNTTKPDISKTIFDSSKIIDEKESKLKPKSAIFDDSKNIDENKSKLKSKSSKSIFDSDSDDDIFSDVKITSKSRKDFNSTKNNNNKTQFKSETQMPDTETLKIDDTKVFQSPSLFEEDEIDDLFINANKAKVVNTPDAIIKHNIPENIPHFDKTIDDLNKIIDVKETLQVNETQIYKDILKEDENKKPFLDTNTGKPEFKSNKSFDDEKDNLFTKHKDTVKVIQENDDLIEPSQASPSLVNVQSKSSSNVVVIQSKMQEPAIKSNFNINTKNEDVLQNILSESNINPQQDKSNDPILDEVPVIEKYDVFPEQKIPVSAAFDDIFSEPPAFEKTKETKKTTNVNALFEDDSDDEALFFKKNDVISDEKPEIFSPSANFGLFDDEPPALLDFAPKTTKNNIDNDDDLFCSVPKKEANTSVITNEPPEMDAWNDDPKDDVPTKPSIPTQKVFPDDDLFSSPELSISDKPINKAESKEIPDSDEELFSNVPKNKPSQKENLEFVKDHLGDTKPTDNKKDIDTKKIGKLDIKNLNINIQALVPGASPKKTLKERSNEDINTYKDENTKITEEKETNSYKNETEIESKTSIEISKSEVDNAEPKSVKSISFETKPEAGVLDNNLSKQRARIQVKRRPSTRRARHEAVRKSVIEFDDDTDNSSSFDEPLPKIIVKNEKPKENKRNECKNETAITHKPSEHKDFIVGKPNTIIKDVLKDDNNDLLKSDDINKGIINIHNEITQNKITGKKSIGEIDAKLNFNSERNEISLNTQNVVENKQTEGSQSTTKVVYILTDEDIFSNIDNTKLTDELVKNTDVADDNDDLFKNKAIGNTYKETNKNIETTKKDITDTRTENIETNAQKVDSLFSDDNDNLFGKVKPKKVEFTSKLFESDSDDDLFNDKKVKEVKKVKGPLFGADDDDDDLFGVKTQTVKESSKMSSTFTKRTSKSKDAAKPTEIVFDDPLSMLDDD